MSLFNLLEDANKKKPLADKVRPCTFDGFVGQDLIVGVNSPIRKLINSGEITSMIFWGSPGTGKTTLARIIAKATESHYRELSAVTSGIKDLRDIIAEAKENLRSSKTRTIVFIDEIHRYNKAQQDAILPFVEDGTIVLIGATTENPSFEVIPALRSRVRIIKLKELSAEALAKILLNALNDENNGLGAYKIQLDEASLNFIINYSSGDARFALNLLENASQVIINNNDKPRIITVELLKSIIQQAMTDYDKSSDSHYDHLSAYQKSLRGSDVDAALYWLAKMLVGGEEPRTIARRLLVCASEDVGNADPMALLIANTAFDSVMKLGMPECRIPLSQATIYVARAPKSNATILSIDKAMDDIRNGKSYPVPLHLKDAHYKDAAKYGHGNDYVYTHNNPEKHQQFLPDQLKNVKYYSE